MSNIEVEIKGRLYVEEQNKFKNWLDDNAIFQREETHKEVYLDNSIASFFSDNGKGALDGKDFLRIRQSDSLTICLKKWCEDKKGELTHCEEFTIAINDFDEALSLFKGLGFFPIVEIFKKRKIYYFGSFEIALDNVDKLGNFFEVEWKGENIEPEKSLIEIRGFLINTGINGYYKLKRGYVSMFLNPNVIYDVYESLKK